MGIKAKGSSNSYEVRNSKSREKKINGIIEKNLIIKRNKN